MASTVSQNFPRTFYKLAPKWEAALVVGRGAGKLSNEMSIKKNCSTNEPIYKIASLMAEKFTSTENIVEEMREVSNKVIFNSEAEQMWIYDHRQSDSLPKSNTDLTRVYQFVRALVTKLFGRDDAYYMLEKHGHITACFFVWYFTTPNVFYKDKVIKQTTRNGIQRIWTPLILDKKPKVSAVQSVSKKVVKSGNTTDTLLPKQQNQQSQLRKEIESLLKMGNSSVSIDWDEQHSVHLVVSKFLTGVNELSINQTKKLQKLYNEYTKLTDKINKTLDKIRKVELENSKKLVGLVSQVELIREEWEDELGTPPNSPPRLVRQSACDNYEEPPSSPAELPDCPGCANGQPNQLAHMGGCLPEPLENDEDEVPESWEDL
jgi:hypothetical protein